MREREEERERGELVRRIREERTERKRKLHRKRRVIKEEGHRCSMRQYSRNRTRMEGKEATRQTDRENEN